jgi:hypothetical protein
VNEGFFDPVPMWGMYILITGLIVLSLELGFWLGTRRRALCDQEQNPVSAMVGATLGLLAFVLAFTFGMAAERFEKRRQVMVDEANSIGTTWLRAAMLPEQASSIRALLRQYVDARIAAVEQGRLIEGMKEADRIQSELWAHAVDLGRDNPRSVVVGLFVESLNDTIDVHAKRVNAGARGRIPSAIWWSLVAVTITSLVTLGYHASLVARRRPPALVAVMVAFAAILGLIADLDRPREGLIQSDQRPMLDLQAQMHAAP